MLSENEIEDLLPAYACGRITEEEGRQIDEWICRSGENRSKAEQYFHLEQLQAKVESIDSSDTEGALKIVHARMRRARGRSVLQWVTLGAAILSIPMLIATALLSAKLHQNESLPPVEICTAAGMTSFTTLPDGSRVWLNSNSRLSYPPRFGRDREVTLDGEGCFEVAKDGRRFLLHTGKAIIEVLGTEFDVEAYSDLGPEVRTTLIDGSVKFHCPDAGGREKTVLMHPGERLIYNSGSGKLSLDKANGTEITAWKEGKTILDNTSLEDALRCIGNRFNVEFLVRNQALLANRYTGTFSGQRLEVVLEHFKRTTKIHFDTNLKGADPDNVSGRQVIIVY